MDRLDITRITSKQLLTALSARHGTGETVQRYLICKTALKRRRAALAALPPGDQAAIPLLRMIGNLERSLEAHRKLLGGSKRR